MVLNLFLAAFLFLHGALHVSYLAPRPPATPGGPDWPFTLERSWLLTASSVAPELTRMLGIALVVVTLAAFTVAAAAMLGIIPGGLWPVGIALGAGSSLALLVLFFHPWLVIGVVIDLALLVVVLLARWAPDTPGT
ncbi:MAG TPA: hypothetical protein VHK05_05450 [Candidatus Limnocylindrales bacterium]|jgi:hypothetical protein|nr:hypothetical protein [Candidatus Limnocylindrales bacterium]